MEARPQGTACNKIPAQPDQYHWAGHDEPVPRSQRQQCQRGHTTTSISPCAQLDDTKFDVRLDQTFSAKDNAFGRFSYDQAFSYVPGGSPGFAEAQRLRQQSAHHQPRAQRRPRRNPRVLANMVNQATFGYNRIFDYITSQGTGTCASANIVPGGIPNANLGCARQHLPVLAPTAAAWFPPSFGRLLVPRRSRLLSVSGWNQHLLFQGLARSTSATSMTSGSGSTIRANQMNVGTEAFQDGFWIVGVVGNFTGLSSAINLAGNSEADFLLGITGLAIHDQTYRGPGHRPPLEDLPSFRRG